MDPTVLAQLDLFSGLSKSEMHRIASRMTEEEFSEGDYLIEQDALAYRFFVVLEGAVEVRRQEVVVAQLGPGDFFGEEGILTLQRRNADVVAVSRVRAAVAVGWDVREFMEEFPSVRAQIVQKSADRSSKDLI